MALDIDQGLSSMRRAIPVTTVLLAALSCFLSISSAYDIAFSDDEAGEIGYEYNFAIPSRVAGSETCNPLPADLNPDTGPREILVRAQSGNTPVPTFIALYSNNSPQLGKCNNHSLLAILAFDPAVFDRQQMQKILVKNVRYWKDIDYNTFYPYRNYASALLSNFRPKPGEFIVKDISRSGWKHRESDLKFFEWDETPVPFEPNEAIYVNSDNQPQKYRLRDMARHAQWNKGIEYSAIDGNGHSENRYPTPSFLEHPYDNAPEQVHRGAERFYLRLPDTPPGIGHGLEISDLASISPPLGRVASISDEISEIPVNGLVDPFSDFIDSLGSLPDMLNIYSNQPQGQDGQIADANPDNTGGQQVDDGNEMPGAPSRDENAFDNLPYSTNFPENIDVSAFYSSPMHSPGSF
ncbi:hypothetical protein TWF718_002448 [Orbilia javanica]|uniref:Uncharacterized protein n=1 Tax=Orbilia javanica TaxID=47235 RepID=A0AAN8MU83_9PEZI